MHAFARICMMLCKIFGVAAAVLAVIAIATANYSAAVAFVIGVCTAAIGYLSFWFNLAAVEAQR